MNNEPYGPDTVPSANYRIRELQAVGESYKRQRDAFRDGLSARADDHAVLDALRAFLADDWRQQYLRGPLLAEALGIDPDRVYLDIRKGEIRLVIRGDGDGGERWDDYAQARAQ